MAWIAGILQGAGSVYSATQDGDSATATEKSTSSPATFNQVGVGSGSLWDEFFGTISGGSQSNIDYGSKQQALADKLAQGDPKRFRLLGKVDAKITNANRDLQAFLKDGSIPSGEDGRDPVQQRRYYEEAAANGTLGNILTNNLRIAEIEKETSFPELAGMYTSVSGAEDVQPSLKDMVAEDTEASKKGWQDYLGTTGDSTSKYIDEIAKNSKDYTTANADAQGKYLDKPAFSFSLGGANMGVTPKGNRDMADLLFGKNLDQANFLNTTAGATKGATDTQAGNQLTFDTTYTPNKAKMDYIDKIYPIIQDIQNWRFGLPSTTTTASGTADKSVEERLGNVSSGVQSLIDAFASNKKKEEE